MKRGYFSVLCLLVFYLVSMIATVGVSASNDITLSTNSWLVKLPPYSSIDFRDQTVVDGKGGLLYVIAEDFWGIDQQRLYIYDGAELQGVVYMTSYGNGVDISDEVHNNSITISLSPQLLLQVTLPQIDLGIFLLIIFAR